MQGDVDRALKLLSVPVHDVGEDAALGRFVHILGILRGQQRDHGAGRLTDDLRDQIERVLGAQPESDERDVGTFALGHGTDFLDVDLARNHLVAEP